MKDFSVLIVDDESDIRDGLKIILESEGYTVTTAEDAHVALDALERDDFQLILSDIMMPDISGLELLKKVRSGDTDTIVVLMTGYSSVQGAIDAIKAGAQDYLIKPINYEDVQLLMERIYQQHKNNMRAEMLLQEISRQRTPPIIGSSVGMRQLKAEIKKVAPVDISVLITGESGTGKELVARAIHEQSSRSKGLFVAINCASIPADLLESELFGHERGAFSGANKQKYGLFEVADKGTILLDEIGEMTPALQAKLLRTIESRSFRRLGGIKEISSDFRVVASTNRDLHEAMDLGSFRSDLFFRLNQFNIIVPPLRDRKSDIPELVDHFAIKNGRQDKMSLEMPECIDLLKQYSWPGNIRELFNALERAFLLAGKNAPGPNDLPPEIKQQVSDELESEVGYQLLSEIENQYILKVYNELGQNKSKAAETLGISIRSLYTKLKQIYESDFEFKVN